MSGTTKIQSGSRTGDLYGWTDPAAEDEEELQPPFEVPSDTTAPTPRPTVGSEAWHRQLGSLPLW